MATKEEYIAIAVAFEKIPYRKNFADEEIQKMQIDHTLKLLDADKKATELHAFKATASAEIKKLLEDAKVLRNKVGAKSDTIEIEAALVPDHEAGVMNYVNVENNDVVYSRRLTPDEKQYRMDGLRKAM